MTLKSLVFLILSFLILVIGAHAQGRTDSLKRVWTKHEAKEIQLSDSLQMSILEEISNSLTYNRPDSAVYYGKLMIELAKGKSNRFLNNAYQIVCRAYYIQGDYNITYNYATKVLALSEQLNNPTGLAMAYNSLGLVYQTQKKLIDAKNSFIKALAAGIKYKDSTIMIKSYFNIGLTYDELQQRDSALIYINKCIVLSELTNNKFHSAMGHNRKGVIYYNLNDFDNSIANHQVAIEHISKENQWELCYAYSGLSRAYNAIKAYENSIEIGKISLEMAKNIGAKWEAQQSSKIISESYENLNDHKNTLKYFKIYKAYSDSIFNTDNEKEINSLHLALTKSENEKLEKENKYHQELLHQKKMQLIWVSIGLFFLIVLLIVLYLSFKNGKINSIKIAAQRDELDQLNKSKDKILSIIAHDMRSPMANISDILYLLSEPDSGIDKVDLNKYYSEISIKVSTVRDTLDNVLQWAITQFKESKADPQIIDLNEVIEEQIKTCEHNISIKDIKLLYDSKTNDKCLVYADKGHVRIIVRNILSNAIKYTEMNGEISINSRDIDQEVIIDISDNGIGMDDLSISKLFSLTINPKYGTSNEMGTGLGLSICNEYIKLNKGKISVQSKLGKGSTFSIHLKKEK